jgi:histidyl-tRNA synthetase
MKPSVPKGTRDFGPVEMLRRKYIFRTIEQVFLKYGFLPLETPAMEHLETLTGKYGEEGDRLIFRIQERGRTFASGVAKAVEAAGTGDMQGLAEATRRFTASEALRYDLTVPFARYVVQHQNDLAFPFKRYQIQPVWRADNPQKGRYREFYQCDADMIGSNGLLNEVELVQLVDEVFQAMGLQVAIKLNNRKLLAGCAALIGYPESALDIAIALDKLEKIGMEQVLAEMKERGVEGPKVEWLINELHRLNTSTLGWRAVLAELKVVLQGSPLGLAGCAELETILDAVAHEGVGVANHLAIDPTLARGLDYYTGAIIEVKALEGTLQSSICGGGRYDDLTGVFGLKGMSGVGISFGADRIYDVLLETGKFPAELGASTRLLFANFGDAEARHCLRLLRQVRAAGIAAELYPDNAKLPKQFTYAEKKGIPYVAIVGDSEMSEGTVTLKRMGANEKGTAMPIEAVIALLTR